MRFTGVIYRNEDDSKTAMSPKSIAARLTTHKIWETWSTPHSLIGGSTGCGVSFPSALLQTSFGELRWVWLLPKTWSGLRVFFAVWLLSVEKVSQLLLLNLAVNESGQF